MKVAPLAFLFICLAQLSTTVLAGSVEDQRNALIDLYNATDGPNWTYNDKWLTNVSYCHWIGVSCMEGTEQVQDISLRKRNLVGTIPESIGVFHNLIYLDLALNTLSGTIPSSIGNLKTLKLLFLSDNLLSGTIPSSVVQLTNVFDFEMSYNQLTGTIPSNIGQLTKIKILNLRDNFLSGTIPASISAMQELVTLQVNENEFTGIDPDLILPTTHLQHCLMDNNPFQCPLSSTHNNFTTLCGAKCAINAPGTTPRSAHVPVRSPTAVQPPKQPSNQPMTATSPISIHEPSGAAPTSHVKPPAEQKVEGHVTAVVVLACLLAVAVIGLVVMAAILVKKMRNDPERYRLLHNEL